MYFLYWILERRVLFENCDFEIKNLENISDFSNYDKIFSIKNNFEKYFDLKWKDFFREFVKVDLDIESSFKKDKYFYVNNLEDYFFALIIQYNDLYFFTGEHFVFHKWFVKEVEEVYFI